MKINNKYELDLLFDSKEINGRVLELAEEINSHYKQDDDLVVICVLHGSVFFCSDLTKAMHKDITLDTVSTPYRRMVTLTRYSSVVSISW